MGTAPRALHEPHSCPLCDSGVFVMLGTTESEKACDTCGYVCNSAEAEPTPDPWVRWREIRNQKYEDDKDCRRRVVGSYVHAYPDYGVPGRASSGR